MTARHFLIQARANRLMNHRLHAAMAVLSREEFHAPRVGFFPSLHATLNHVITVDWYYLDALEGGHHGAHGLRGLFGRAGNVRHERRLAHHFLDRLRGGRLRGGLLRSYLLLCHVCVLSSRKG